MTPKGTRILRILRPLGRSAKSEVLPTGSGSFATSSKARATASKRFSSKERRSTKAFVRPAASAASTSAALAARTQAERARKARASYERCASLDPGIVEVPRQLGLLYYQQGQSDRAREAFTRYIALAPDAPDAPRVKEYVAALTR